jgi:hypothetical protein
MPNLADCPNAPLAQRGRPPQYFVTELAAFNMTKEIVALRFNGCEASEPALDMVAPHSSFRKMRAKIALLMNENNVTALVAAPVVDILASEALPIVRRAGMVCLAFRRGDQITTVALSPSAFEDLSRQIVAGPPPSLLS